MALHFDGVRVYVDFAAVATPALEMASVTHVLGAVAATKSLNYRDNLSHLLFSLVY